MTATTRHEGLLARLRRCGVVGLVVLAVSFAVGVLRGEALAEVALDELCVAMGGTRVVEPIDPADLTDASHACCDLGGCLAGGALPGAAPVAAALTPALLLARRLPVPADRPRGRRPRRAHGPRAPPTL